MNLECNGRNLCIVDKKAQLFRGIDVTERMISVENEKGTIFRSILVDKIYACMYCELLCNITIIIDDETIYKVSFVMEDDNVFKNVLQTMKNVCKNADISEQNKKINGYATALVEKMKAGIELHIVESSDEVKVPICPVCGMQCDPGIPYCMECGASIE